MLTDYMEKNGVEISTPSLLLSKVYGNRRQ